MLNILLCQDLSCATDDPSVKKVSLAADYRVLEPGDTTTGGKKFDITVKEVTDPFTIGNEFIRKDVEAAGKRAIGLVLSVTNKTGEPQKLDEAIFSKAVDDDLNCSRAQSMGIMLGGDDPKANVYSAEPLGKTLGTGKTTDLHLVYETGKDIKKLTLYFVTGSEAGPEVFAGVALSPRRPASRPQRKPPSPPTASSTRGSGSTGRRRSSLCPRRPPPARARTSTYRRADRAPAAPSGPSLAGCAAGPCSRCLRAS